MEQISKPHIVDLLRIFDRKRMIIPRIRYASVRSKPELIADLKKYFSTHKRDGVLHFKPRGQTALSHIPRIAYNFQDKQYLFDGRPFDVPAESRKKVRFSISHVPVTLFQEPFLPPTSPPSKCKAAASSPGSPGLGSSDPGDFSERVPPCCSD